MAITPVIKYPGTLIIPGMVINGTNTHDVLDDLLRTSEGGISDPGTNDTINGLDGWIILRSTMATIP